jgi:hypothetical protein
MLHGEDEDDDKTVDFDSTTPSPTSDIQIITIEDTPAKSGSKSRKRIGEDKDVETNKKKNGTSSTKRRKSNSNVPPSMVTPDKAECDDKIIAEELDKTKFDPHSVIAHEDALKLLSEYYGLTREGIFFFFPFQEKPVATSLLGLRKELCENGLPKSIQPLSKDEKINIARWVRYHIVSGLTDGQCVSSLTYEKCKFMKFWCFLDKNFGCEYKNRKYYVPTSPDRTEIKIFEETRDVDRHFARFGLQCIPDDVPEDMMSRNFRLEMELFFATPSFDVLNTL